MTKTTKKAFDLDEILSSPLVLWIIAVTSAVLMWVYVTGMDESAYINRKFSAPIEYRYLDPQAILRGRLSEVDIEVKGPEEEIMRLDYNSIIAYVNARNLVPGKRYTVNIDVDLPACNVSLIS